MIMMFIVVLTARLSKYAKCLTTFYSFLCITVEPVNRYLFKLTEKKNHITISCIVFEINDTNLIWNSLSYT